MTAADHADGHAPSELATPEPLTTAGDQADGSAAKESAGQERAGQVSRSRSWLASPGWQGLLALAVYLAIWVLGYALPLVLHPGRPALDQSSMDPNFYTWGLRWWPYAIGHGLNPLHTTQLNAPGGASLAWITTIPPLAVLATPVTLLAGPIVAFNLLVALSVPVSAWAAFVLCRRLTGKFWPALAGGAIYGFSAYQLNHIVAGQLNLTFSLLLPLMGYLVLLWRDKAIGDRGFVIWLGLAMAVQFYLFLETYADMTAIIAASLLVGWLLAGRAGRPAIARLSLLTGIAYVASIILAVPYLGYALTHVPKGFIRSPAGSSVDVASLLIPRPGQTFGISWLAAHTAALSIPGRDGYIGIPLLILAIVFAIRTWSSKVTRFLTIMLAFTIVVAIGPVLHFDNGRHGLTLPWKHLWYLPVVRSAYPARLMVFAFLALAVIVALWLAGRPQAEGSRQSRTAAAGWPWARWLLGLLAIAAVAANTPTLTIQPGAGLPTFISSGSYRHYLKPGSTIVVVSTVRGNAGMLWQADTGFYTRIAGGFLNAAIAHGSDLPRAVADLGSLPLTGQEVRRFHSFVRTAKISAILLEAGSAPSWQAVFRQLGLHGQQVGGVTLYRTGLSG
jgi:hypothetical protein